MERKRVYNPRCYRHLCPAHGSRERQTAEKICPDCGQHGEFYRWFRSIIDSIAIKSRVIGFTCVGPQMTFLPRMTRSCERCRGEGIIAGGDFDYECPDCGGNGIFLDRTDEEMRKIRCWAQARRARYVWERNHPEETGQSSLGERPQDFILDRAPESFIRGMMGMVEYAQKFAERNQQIGELMLRCDNLGWDVFMEMIELWENSGRGLAVTQSTILLKGSLRKNAATLLELCPPSTQQPQRMLVNRKEIRQGLGREKERELWLRMANLNPSNDNWVPIDGRITKADAREWKSELSRSDR